MSYEIHTGDVFDGLSKIPDESVQCCVTSPPYWGLRDYGTGKWSGGDSECDHILKKARNDHGREYGPSDVQTIQFSHTCGDCGAVRIDGQIGLEKTPEEYVEKMVRVFREVRRVLRKDGTLFLNLGDTYHGGGGGGGNYGTGISNRIDGQHLTNVRNRLSLDGLKPKDLVGIPWRVAFALQADGWWLRQDIIWAKPNPMPESVTDRCTKAHEYIFLLTKSAKYYYDAEAVRESARNYGIRDRTNWTKRIDAEEMGQTPHGGMGGEENYAESGRNLRSVWTITTKPFKGAHFATFPPEIPERCIKAGSKKEDTVLDPFAGSGTTGEVALRLGRKFIGIELNEKYVKDLVIPRLEGVSPLGIKN